MSSSFTEIVPEEVTVPQGEPFTMPSTSPPSTSSPHSTPSPTTPSSASMLKTAPFLLLLLLVALILVLFWGWVYVPETTDSSIVHVSAAMETFRHSSHRMLTVCLICFVFWSVCRQCMILLLTSVTYWSNSLIFFAANGSFFFWESLASLRQHHTADVMQ